LQSSLCASSLINALNFISKLNILFFQQLDIFFLFFYSLFVLISFSLHQISDAINLIWIFFITVILFGLTFFVGLLGCLFQLSKSLLQSFFTLLKFLFGLISLILGVFHSLVEKSNILLQVPSNWIFLILNYWYPFPQLITLFLNNLPFHCTFGSRFLQLF